MTEDTSELARKKIISDLKEIELETARGECFTLGFAIGNCVEQLADYVQRMVIESKIETIKYIYPDLDINTTARGYQANQFINELKAELARLEVVNEK